MFFLTLCLCSDSWTSIYIINRPALSEHGGLALHGIETAVTFDDPRFCRTKCSTASTSPASWVKSDLLAFSFVCFNYVQRSHKHLNKLSHTSGQADLKSRSFFVPWLKTWHLLSLMVVSLLKVKMSVLAETFVCVHFINEFQEYTNVGLGGYMIWNKWWEPRGYKTTL